MAEKQYAVPECAAWMRIAIRRHALPLLDYVSGDEADQLRSFYEQAYPVRERLPIQEQIMKRLKKG